MKRNSERSQFSILSLSLFIAASAAATGCGGVTENAKRSADNSLRAADNSDVLLQTSLNAYGDGRQGAARDRRLQELTRMEQAQGLDGKQVAAAVYLTAFEFQLWKQNGNKEDNEAKRQALYADAVAEFLKTARDYQAERGNNFMALAVTLQKLNGRQVEASSRYGFKAVSMLDLLQDGISSKTAVESGQTSLDRIPRYQVEVLKEEAVAIQLLQTRYQALVGSVLMTLLNPESIEEMKAGKSKTWTAKTSELSNLAVIQDRIIRLKGAQATAAVLASAGVAVELPASAQALIPVLAMPEIKASASVEASARDRQIAELIELLKSFTKKA